jgi:hypothetical protein
VGAEPSERPWEAVHALEMEILTPVLLNSHSPRQDSVGCSPEAADSWRLVQIGVCVRALGRPVAIRNDASALRAVT